jgi:hypothetical protein
MYRALDPGAILKTCRLLTQRVTERFPESGLGRVSAELFKIAGESAANIDALRRPYWPTRLGIAAGLVIIIGAAIGFIASYRGGVDVGGLSDLLQGLEAAVNDIVFIGVAIYFLLTIESRLKRRRALRSLHELRSIAHVIDMHQLTKDPELLLSPAMATASSPQRGMTRFELARYLDYCSEMLAITSKLAALYVQYLNDGIVLDAVNNIQNLTAGLSAKIWQKIVILDSVAGREPAVGSS